MFRIVNEEQVGDFKMADVECPDGRHCLITRWRRMSDADVLDVAKLWAKGK
jgi:hypothetical protein